MYIEPNTEIRILKNVPIDSEYNNTLWFDTLDKQRAYFTSMLRYELTKHSYQRVNRNTMRVQIKYENLYDCNYLMFQNTSFGNKWFYAFILNVNYINDVTSEIVYQIDVLQTWLFDYSINQCYVLREHSVTDNVGDNIVEEGLNTGTIITIDTETISALDDLSIVLCCTHDVDGEVVNGHLWNKVYTGFNYFVYPATTQGVQDVNNLIKYIVENYGADGIVGCVMCPTQIAVLNNVKYDVDINKNLGAIGGNYIPKNKKLFTYPYNYLQVTNGLGQSVDYKYEFFDKPDTKVTFEYIGTCDLSPSVYLYPHSSYKGKTDNYNEGIPLTDFPQCATTADSFKAWLAQNSNRTIASYGSSTIKAGISGVQSALTHYVPSTSRTQTISAMSGSSIGGLAMAGATPNSIGAGMGGFGSRNEKLTYSVRDGVGGYRVGENTAGYIGAITDIGLTVWDAIATKEDLEALPPTYHGTQNGSINVLLGRQTFTFEKKTITKEYAKTIDNFFSMFGYATKKLKVPNRNSRPHWNYVKTLGCTIKGSIPQDDQKVICAIHDKGVTYWKNGSEVGDYSLDNSPR